MTYLLKHTLVMLGKLLTLSTHAYLMVYILRVFLKSSLTTSHRRIRRCNGPIGCGGPLSPHKPVAMGHSDRVVRDGPCLYRQEAKIRAGWAVSHVPSGGVGG